MDLDELNNYGADDLEEKLVLKKLRSLIISKLNELDITINLIRQNKINEAFELEKENSNIDYLEQINQMIEKYNSVDNEELEEIVFFENILNDSFILILFFEISIVSFLLLMNLKRKEKEIENEKIFTEQMKLASMGEMIGNIAHQWRQPLSAISALASSMKVESQLDLLSKKDIDSKLDDILNKTSYLSETINTFRNFLKDNKDYTELAIEELVDNSLKILNSALKDSHVKLINNIDLSNQTLVKMVGSELPQVVINIVNNAKDALLENEVSNKWIKVNLTNENKKCIITIEDNAGGIPKDVLPRIFEPYFTTKHQTIGTGLGLSMSYKIVTESLKGKLVASNTQNGALFTIEIPIEN